MQTFGTLYLARVLGVSPARARKLLAEGRIQGARKHRGTGEWIVPGGNFMLARGKRGPRSRHLEETLASIQPPKLARYEKRKSKTLGWVYVAIYE
jgi:hypothetical protein